EESDVLGAVYLLQLAELLVRQRLHGRRIERLVAVGTHRQVDREFAHDGLAGARRGSDQHAGSALESAATLDLERIEVEALRFGEFRRDGVLALRARFGVLFRG